MVSVRAWIGVLLGSCGLLVSLATAQSPPGDVDAILAAAHTAIGGAPRIADVTSLIITGRTRQVRGDNLVPVEFEVDFQRPDKYVRRDEIPAQESGPAARGFNGAQLIQSASPAGRPGVGPPPPPPGARGSGPPPAAQRPALPPVDPVQVLKQDFTRLALGLFVGSLDVVPLEFTAAGTAEAPEGTADALDVTGPSGFTSRLFLSRATHLPLMVSWPGPASPTGPAENRLYFADVRDVEHFKLPFRIRRAVGASTIEETTIDRYRINGKIDARRFDVKP